MSNKLHYFTYVMGLNIDLLIFYFCIGILTGQSRVDSRRLKL